MKKLLTALCFAASFSAPAQTLFTYGNKSVAATEFLRAFQKNNQGAVTEKAVKDYFELYLASRLKIQAAKDQGFDTLPQLVADLANLRQQILPAYLNDKETVDRLVKEAFSRSQKDIRLAHIFIKGGEDMTVAEQKKAQVLQALNKSDFAAVARQYSDDPAAATNSGDLGWITVFSLPYELETLAYSTPVGKNSAVYSSKSGFHIFKNTGERKALGRIKAAQILLAIPPNSTEADKKSIRLKADSLYKRLVAGADFGKLAAAFSNDVVSSASNGQMAEFGVGEYDPVFETAVAALSRDGVVGKPFVTAHGYHLVKRIKVAPAAAALTDDVKEELRKRIAQSDRMQFSKLALAQKVLKESGYRKLSFSDAELQAYTDSVLAYQVPKAPLQVTPKTAVLTMGNSTATAADFTNFAQTARLRPDGSGAKPFAQLWQEFVQTTALNYYQDHLEDFNEEFRQQMTEFADGNLFFEIMQRQVWTPAQTDSAALLAYFEAHKTDYTWKESADAVVFYAVDATAARAFHKALSQKPGNWKTHLLNFSEQITADSNRFELTQLPAIGTVRLAKETLTAPVINKADNTASFAYVLQLYPKPAPRNFSEARGLVINDYQAHLEKDWVEKLKSTYPVAVDEKIWAAVVKKASGK